MEIHFRARPGMFETQVRRMQTDAVRSRTAIQNISQDRETLRTRMNADLMRSARDRFGFNQRASRFFLNDLKPRLGAFTAGMQRMARIFFSNAHQRGNYGALLKTNRPVRQQPVFFAHAAFG